MSNYNIFEDLLFLIDLSIVCNIWLRIKVIALNIHDMTEGPFSAVLMQ